MKTPPLKQPPKDRAHSRPRQIVAIEGKLTPTRTPAIRAALLGKPGMATPDHSTALATPLAAREGHDCLVLGAKESSLASAFCAAAEPRVAKLGGWLTGDRAGDDELGVTSTATGSYVVWLCSRAEAMSVLAIVASEAQKLLGRALRAGHADDAYAYAFWLQRASLDARDWLLAAAALAHAGHEDAGKSLRQAAFDHLSSGDRESLLAAAERRLQQVLADSAPRSSLRACANDLRERQMQVRDSSPKAA